MPLFPVSLKYLFTMFALICAMAWALPASAEEDENGLGSSGLPIPRFVSLRFEEVNLRTGPGTRYPIRWVYHRKNLPVEIIEEFGHWRKVRDHENEEGWVHKSQLTGNRYAIMKEDITLQRYPEAGAPPLVRAEEGVVVRLLECDPTWCRVQTDSYKAWTQKGNLWGIYLAELI